MPFSIAGWQRAQTAPLLKSLPKLAQSPCDPEQFNQPTPRPRTHKHPPIARPYFPPPLFQTLPLTWLKRQPVSVPLPVPLIVLSACLPFCPYDFSSVMSFFECLPLSLSAPSHQKIPFFPYLTCLYTMGRCRSVCIDHSCNCRTLVCDEQVG